MMSKKSRERVHKMRMNQLVKKQIENLRTEYKETDNLSASELQIEIEMTKHNGKMFRSIQLHPEIKACSFNTKFWITKYISEVSSRCMSNPQKQFNENKNVDWQTYLQFHIEQMRDEKWMDYIFSEEVGFSKEDNFKTLEYLQAKYKCQIKGSNKEERVAYQIFRYPNFSYEEFSKGITLLGVIQEILYLPLNLIRKLVNKIKYRNA